MAETNSNACPESDPAERDFRKKNLWVSFKGYLYQALGGACFIGLLTQVTSGLVKAVAGEAGAAAMFGAGPVGVMIGLMAAGVACLYMAQKEFTDLRCIQDEHLAHQNALQLNGNGHVKAHAQEFTNPGRGDGKSWEQVALAQKAQQQSVQQATR